MSDAEKEQKSPQEVQKLPETPGEAARAGAQAVKETEAATALAKAESEIPPEAEMTLEARAREIAQRYLETITEADRKLMDPKQVERLLSVLENTADPKSHLFSNVDKLGKNLPSRGIEPLGRGDAKGVAEAYRAFAKDPIDLSKETDKLQQIANSTLPESVRAALLSIILKEGNYPATAMAKEVAEKLEETGDLKALTEAEDKYAEYKNPEMMKDKSLRQESARQLMEGLYPDLLKSGEVALLRDIGSLSFEQGNDKATVVAVVERYNQVVGDATFSRQYRELGGAKNGGETLSKLQDSSITDRDVGRVVGVLQRELRQYIAKKATSTEIK